MLSWCKSLLQLTFFLFKAADASQLVEKCSFLLMIENPHDMALPFKEAIFLRGEPEKLYCEQQVGSVDLDLLDQGQVHL